MTRTVNLGLLYLSSAQQSKEIAVNESFAILDILGQGRILDKDLATPPAEPEDGDAYIVAASATDDWLGREDDIAFWFDEAGAWRFVTPNVGWSLYVVDEAKYYRFEADEVWRQYILSGPGTVEVITPDTATAHTLSIEDNGSLILFNSVSDCVLTLPEQLTESLTSGYHALAMNIGLGNLSFAVEGSDILNGVSLSQNPSQPVTAILQVAGSPNTWGLIGNQWLPAAVEDDSLTAPPGTTPLKGAVFIPAPDSGGDAGGAWVGHVDHLAIHVGSDAYEFVIPPVGWQVYEKTSGLWIGWTDSSEGWVNV